MHIGHTHTAQPAAKRRRGYRTFTSGRVQAAYFVVSLCVVALLIGLVGGLGTRTSTSIFDLAASASTVYKPGFGYLLGPLLIAVLIPGDQKHLSRWRVLASASLWVVGLIVLAVNIASLGDAYTIKTGTYVSAALMTIGLIATLAMWPTTPQAVGDVATSAPAQAAVAPTVVAPTVVEPAVAPADWYRDPLGQAEFRYWDGRAWTAYTTGETAAPPPPAVPTADEPATVPAPALPTDAALPRCATCDHSFDWDDAYRHQTTPGSSPHNPPGHGAFRPRAFCPNCGALVAEWHIDVTRDYDEWAWYGENRAINAGAKLPPSPLVGGGRDVPIALLPTIDQHRLDIDEVHAYEHRGGPPAQTDSSEASSEPVQEGYRLLQDDRVDEALLAFERARGAGLNDHDYACALGSLGLILLSKREDVARAFRYSRESVEVDPSAYWQAHYILSLVYEGLGSHDRAEQAMQAAQRFAFDRWWESPFEEQLRHAVNTFFASGSGAALIATQTTSGSMS